MRSKYSILTVATAAFFAVFVYHYSAWAIGDAGRFVNDIATKVLQTVNDEQLSRTEQEQRIHALAVENFDVPAIARFVLGGYWRSTTSTERQAFTEVFEDYMVRVYTSRFIQYRDVTFHVTREQPESDNKTLVYSEIIRTGDQPRVKLDWWVSKKNGTYKIADVSIEGISQLLTYRDEFTSVLDRNGGRIPALVEQLRDKLYR